MALDLIVRNARLAGADAPRPDAADGRLGGPGFGASKGLKSVVVDLASGGGVRENMEPLRAGA